MRKGAKKGVSVNAGGHHPSSSSDFSSAAARAAPVAAKQSLSSRIPFASACMWILNIGLVGAAYFALSNWTTINWLTGSYGWSALLEIGALLLLLYLFLIGTCLMGWSGRVERSFLHLGDSPQLLYLFALALPFLCVSFFGALTVLALSNLSATNIFVATYAEAVFKQASVYVPANSTTLRDATTQAVIAIDVWSFMKHICSMTSLMSQCGWYTITPPAPYTFTFTAAVTANSTLLYEFPFFLKLSKIFTGMENTSTQTITIVEIFRGVQKALAPYKQRFGWSVLAITVICLAQFAYYWIKWRSFTKANKKSEDQEKEHEPFIGP